MKVLVFGAQGMLGKDLVPALTMKHQVFARDIEDLSITDRSRVQKEIEALRPQVVVNAAAYTDVDGCEARQELALAVNAEGVKNIALACSAIDAQMIHFSTDYVFDGSSPVPYREEDFPKPLNVYGHSKLQGEHYLQDILKNHLIIRTQWLYGKHGKNFVDTILKLAEQQKELRIVNDQKGSPTFTKDLSWAIEKLLATKAKGILHVTNSGSCTWYEFALEILKMRKAAKDEIQVTPISSAELARAAKRPLNSAFDCRRFETFTGQKMRPWEEALRDYLSEK
jgi:dTDP-4-dehydrorhamnose reductase